jgi:hypothetical protein
MQVAVNPEGRCSKDVRRDDLWQHAEGDLVGVDEHLDADKVTANECVRMRFNRFKIRNDAFFSYQAIFVLCILEHLHVKYD